MLKFTANITQLYTDRPFLDRFAAAAADGFTGIEFRNIGNATKEQVAAAADKAGVKIVLFNFPMGDWAAGERGIAALPGREGELRGAIDGVIGQAEAFGCTQVNCPAGLVPQGASREAAEATLVENLRLAAQRLGERGIRLQLEPVNDVDMPGCAVSTTDDYERIAQKVGSPNLWLQYDFYHMQVMQGDLMRTFQRLQPRIAHVQIAEHPGRHEPGTGEINYDFIFAELDRLGYDGWVGCEYVPAGDTSAGLGWFRKLQHA